MTKHEFITKLTTALGVEKNEEVADLLADFEEHFTEALSEGKSEADICAALGDPKEIATAYRDAFANVEETKPHVGTGVVINLRQYNLVCESSEIDEFECELRHQNMVVDSEFLQVIKSDNMLQVTELPRRDILRFLLSGFRNETVHVKIPRRFQGDILANIMSGNASLNKISIEGDMSCELMSGNITMTDFKARHLNATSLSGNVSLTGCTGVANAESKSGNVKIKEHTGEVAQAVSHSGNVVVGTADCHGNSSFESKSGNVKAELGTLSGYLQLSCASGNIKFSIRELRGNITAETKSGNVYGVLSRDTKATFITRSSGMKNAFPSHMTAPSDYPIVKLTSISGNVKVEELLL